MTTEVAPWPKTTGETFVIVGAVALAIWKTVLLLPLPVSGLVTVTVLKPVEIPEATETVVVMVELFVTVVGPFTVIFGPNETVAPVTKFAPLIVTGLLASPGESEAGLTDEIVGAAATVNKEFPVPVPPSGFVTITFLVPVAAAPATVTFAVN